MSSHMTEEEIKEKDIETEEEKEKNLKNEPANMTNVTIEVTDTDNLENLKNEESIKVSETVDKNDQKCAVSSSPQELPPRETKAVGEGVNPPPIHIANGFEIISIKDRHGQFRKAVPEMPLPLAIICCFVNLVLPGIGTIMSSFSVFCCGKSEYETKSQAFLLNLVAGFLQLLTAIILVGWIWSIIWGVTFVTIATNRSKDSTDNNLKVSV